MNKILQPGDIIPQAGSWEGFELNVFGTDLVDMTGFGLDYEAEFEVNYGKGGEAVSWSIKKYKRSAKATITFDQMEYLFTLATIYGGDLLKLPPAPVNATCQIGNKLFKLIVPAAKIIKFPLDWKEGSSKMDVPLDFGLTSYPVITLV
jgi:hypothetical protein